MRRLLRFSALSIAGMLITISCQTNVEMFGNCTVPTSGDPTGTDGEYLLVCDDGTWQPAMTMEEYSQIVQGEPTKIATLPTQPTTTTTSTTTTTIPEPKTFAIAYSNVDGEEGFDAEAGDRLIAKLVDTNEDDEVSVGDTITFSEYPADAAMSQFYNFVNKTHTVDDVDTVNSEVIRVEIEENDIVTWEHDEVSEKIIEGSFDDNIFLQDRYAGGAGGDISITDNGPVQGEQELYSNTGGANLDQDYLEVDITL